MGNRFHAADRRVVVILRHRCGHRFSRAFKGRPFSNDHSVHLYILIPQGDKILLFLRELAGQVVLLSRVLGKVESSTELRTLICFSGSILIRN